MPTGLRLVCEAAELAARLHTGQQRKGRRDEPYINHLAEVASLLAAATDGEDAELVAAGWLHDTIEDTDICRDTLAQRFGARVADMVEDVTDDMNLAKSERRRLQVVEAPTKSPGAKLIKISDKISNIRARIFSEPQAAQQQELADYLAWAEQVVNGCRGVNARLDALFDETAAKARATL